VGANDASGEGLAGLRDPVIVRYAADVAGCEVAEHERSDPGSLRDGTGVLWSGV
jgi:hypothetical protein